MFNAAEEHGSDVTVITEKDEITVAGLAVMLLSIRDHLRAIDARLDVIESQNTRATEVIEQVGAEVGPIVEKLQGSYLMKVLGGK